MLKNRATKAKFLRMFVPFDWLLLPQSFVLCNACGHEERESHEHVPSTALLMHKGEQLRRRMNLCVVFVYPLSRKKSRAS